MPALASFRDEVIPRETERKSVDPAAKSKGNFNGIPSSSAANAPISKAQVQTISIDRDETIRINNEVVDADSLAARLLDLKRSNPDVAIVIRPDRELPVQKLVTLMDSLQRAQITKVGIATKAESK